jgi:K+-transporting ATPase ATPase C chain
MRELRTALVALLAFTVLTGIAYPLVVLGIAQVAFPHQANGSLYADRHGSELLGQPFTQPRYFWSRPSALTPAYGATNSTATNFGESNAALHDAVRDRVAALRAADPGNTAPVPIDLVTASASGLDPHISPEAAYYQAGRVARARGLVVADVEALIAAHVEPRTLGFLGEPRVNVVAINRALDAGAQAPR